MLDGSHWLTSDLAEHSAVALVLDDAYWIEPASAWVVGHRASLVSTETVEAQLARVYARRELPSRGELPVTHDAA